MNLYLLTKRKQILHFNTSLSAKNIVPHENFEYTNATGEANVTISKNETMVHFKVNVANIIDVTAAHFHTAIVRYNDGVVVTIYPGTSTQWKDARFIGRRICCFFKWDDYGRVHLGYRLYVTEESM